MATLMRVPPAAALAASALLLAAFPAAAVLPSEPAVVVGQGTVTFIPPYPGFDCSGMDFDIQVAGVGTAAVTIQAVHPSEVTCNTGSYHYSLNPSLVTGSWRDGWAGDALGAEPPVLWPVWEVLIGPATDPARVAFWSYYQDVNHRDYYLFGEFAIVHAA